MNNYRDLLSLLYNTFATYFCKVECCRSCSQNRHRLVRFHYTNMNIIKQVLEFRTDQQTGPTDRQTDMRAHREDPLLIKKPNARMQLNCHG